MGFWSGVAIGAVAMAIVTAIGAKFVVKLFDGAFNFRFK